MDTETNIWNRSLYKVQRYIGKARFFSAPRGPERFDKTLKTQASRQYCYNVLIIIQNMSYTYDTRVQNIVNTLIEAGKYINVICPRYPGDPKNLRLNGLHVRFYYLPPNPGKAIGYLIEYTYSISIISLLALSVRFRKRIDVIHICNPPDFFFLLGKVFQMLNSRYIYDKHDCVPELFKERFSYKSSLIQGLLRKAEDLTERTADHILTTNVSAKKKAIMRNTGTAQKITVVRNAPNIEIFPNVKLSRPNNEKIEVGYVGNMNPQDCVDLLLESAHYIKFVKRRTDIRFVLIGDGSATVKLKYLSRNLNINDIVEFTGRLQPNKAYNRLSSVHICAQPDRKNEFTDTCTMVKDLEYMALAKPIVAFDLRETRISCGASALYATNNSHENFAEQILKLADDPKLRINMGEIGRKRLYQHFTWPHSEKQLLNAYEAVMIKST